MKVLRAIPPQTLLNELVYSFRQISVFPQALLDWATQLAWGVHVVLRCLTGYLAEDTPALFSTAALAGAASPQTHVHSLQTKLL
ncbi:hypothetical protein WJX77_010962 [Trebouxia sp. C0004]